MASSVSTAYHPSQPTGDAAKVNKVMFARFSERLTSLALPCMLICVICLLPSPSQGAQCPVLQPASLILCFFHSLQAELGKLWVGLGQAAFVFQVFPSAGRGEV